MLQLRIICITNSLANQKATNKSAYVEQLDWLVLIILSDKEFYAMCIRFAFNTRRKLHVTL